MIYTYMSEHEIMAILDTPDDEVYVELISSEEAEALLAKKSQIVNCASIAITTSGFGACCCAQVDASCGTGAQIDSSCTGLTVDAGCT